MTIQRIFPFIIFFFVTALVFPGKAAQAETMEKYKRTVENYAVPDVTLLNQNGAKVKLRTLLNSKRVVMVDFIYTTCTTICPVLSAGFSNFQRRIGPDSKNVQLVSISIDPENDSPKRLREYLKRYDAKAGWDFLTGSKDDIEKVANALNAYASNKMYHLPLALLYSPSDNKWVRIYGLIGTSDLISEYEKVVRR
jgi:protein SCO1/2